MTIFKKIIDKEIPADIVYELSTTSSRKPRFMCC